MPGFVCALLVTALGICGIRDALVALKVFHGQAWSRQLAGYLHGLTPNGWMILVGVIAALVGLWFLVLGLAPRRRAGVAASSSGTVWISPGDLARISASVARQQPGVLRASASAKPKAVKISVVGTPEQTGELQNAVSSSVTQRLSVLHERPKVKVRARTGGGSR